MLNLIDKANTWSLELRRLHQVSFNVGIELRKEMS